MIDYNFTTEKGFNDYILNLLKEYLSIELKKYNLDIDKNKKILKDLTIAPRKLGGFDLVFGFADIDIVIYKKIDDLIPTLNSIKGIKLESLRKENSLIVPVVIIELKLRNVNSHSMIPYSHIAGEIKEKFPFCMFNMIIFESNKRDITILRHSKNFNRVLILQKQFYKKDKPLPKDSVKDIVESIKLHFHNLAEREII